MTQISLSLTPSPYGELPVEIVERKGIGHPDTICDALAEELSRALCQFYLKNFGFILHHNVDKVLLRGGSSQAAFNGGEILAPIEIYMAGRATFEYKGIEVPVDELVESSCRNWLEKHISALDASQQVIIHNLIRPGSSDLVELFLRQQQTGVALANDTSCGVGYAPLSELEQVVLEVEHTLNSSAIKSQHPEIGADIKVMGVKRHHHLDLTVACAYIDQYITDISDYQVKKLQLTRLVETIAAKYTDMAVMAVVNSADDIDVQSVYLTVTGTSAESGDDGEVGRGNRVNGLISPYRPMNMEAAAGKNPVTHVGKLYNILAQMIASEVVGQLAGVEECYCYLVSQIGSPVDEPKVVDLKLHLQEGITMSSIQVQVEEIIRDKLAGTQAIQQDVVAGLLVY
ncbi:MAG: methionine adenosyltransferase [Gammaproteobacteria bacterium]|nr:methionine adenosyltransferase [Gammaproteobacteria bacterium]